MEIKDIAITRIPRRQVKMLCDKHGYQPIVPINKVGSAACEKCVQESKFPKSVNKIKEQAVKNFRKEMDAEFMRQTSREARMKTKQVQHQTKWEEEIRFQVFKIMFLEAGHGGKRLTTKYTTPIIKVVKKALLQQKKEIIDFFYKEWVTKQQSPLTPYGEKLWKQFKRQVLKKEVGV